MICWIKYSRVYLIPEPLGGVRNLQVTDPTTSTLNVKWDPAEGNVRQYKVNYVPTAGGPQETVTFRPDARNQDAAPSDSSLLSRSRFRAGPTTPC